MMFQTFSDATCSANERSAGQMKGQQVKWSIGPHVKLSIALCKIYPMENT